MNAILSFVLVIVLLEPCKNRELDHVNLISKFCVAVVNLHITSSTPPEGRINELFDICIFPLRVMFAVVLPREVIISCEYEVPRSVFEPIIFTTRAVASHADHDTEATS